MFFVFLVAFIIRLIGLNQSFWLDEATTAQVVKHYSLSQIWLMFSPNDFHPPLYYLFLKLWSTIFGYSEIVLRMPSIIFSLGAGYVIYRMVILLYGYIVARWAVLFFLFNPLIIYYSQEARMYMMNTFLIVLIMYVFIKLKTQKSKVKTQKSKLLIIINLFIFLSLATFYGSVFFIVSIYLYLLIKKQGKLLFSLLPGSIVAGLVLFPLFIQQLNHSKIILIEVVNWSSVLGKAELKNLFLIPIKFTSGRIGWEPKITYYLATCVWLLTIVSIVFQGIFQLIQNSKLKSQKYNEKLKSEIQLLIFLLIVPVVLGFGVSLYKPLLQYFRFLYLIVPLSVLMAFIIQKNWQKQLVVGGFLLFSFLYLLFPKFHREDWKSLVVSLPQNVIVYMIPSSSDSLLYYNPKIKIKDIRSNSLFKNNKVIVIPYSSDIYGFDYRQKFISKGFVQKEEKVFHGLTYQIWTKSL